MKRLALLVLLPLSVFAQPWGTGPNPIISYAPIVNDITATSAKVHWVTDTATSSRIQWGLTTTYDHDVNWYDNTLVTQSNTLVLTGLPAGQLIHYSICSRDTSSRETCSTDLTFNTLALPSPYPEFPILPTAVSTTVPAAAVNTAEYPTGHVFTVDSTCSNLTSILATVATLTDAGPAGTGNYEIRIPPQSSGTACIGQWTLPVRTHTGWVIIRSAAADAALPPPGVRTSMAYQANMAKLVEDVLPLPGSGSATLPTSIPASCQTDQWHMWTAAIKPPLMVCADQGSGGGAKTVTAATWSSITVDPLIPLSTTTDIELTVVGHGYLSGQIVTASLSGVTIQNDFNNTTSYTHFLIDVVDADHFRLRDTDGSGTFTSGTVTRIDNWREVFYNNPATSTRSEGDTLPGTCTVGHWFFRTNQPLSDGLTTQSAVNHRQLYWCTSPDTWTKFRLKNVTAGLAAHPVLQTAAGAGKYWMTGIDFTHQPMANPHPAGWNSVVNTTIGLAGSAGTLIEMHTAPGSNIMFDRNIFRGQGYPSKLGSGIELGGTNVGVINSYFDKIERWVHGRTSAINGESYAVRMTNGGHGPCIIENNYVSGHGILIFFDQGDPDKAPNHDCTVRRNAVVVPDMYRHGSLDNIEQRANKVFYHRHCITEWKNGVRMLVEGNQCYGTFADSNRGGMIMITPTVRQMPIANVSINGATVTYSSAGTTSLCGSGHCTGATGFTGWPDGAAVWVRDSTDSAHIRLYTISGTPTSTTLTLSPAPTGTSTGVLQCIGCMDNVQIADITIRHNYGERGTNFGSINGLWNQSGTAGGTHARQTRRVWYDNNHVAGLNHRSFASGGHTSDNGADTGNAASAYFLAPCYGVDSLRVTRNAVYDVWGSAQSFMRSDSSCLNGSLSSGLLMSRNIYAGAVNSGSDNPLEIAGTTTRGTAYLNAIFASWTDDATNVFCCGLSSTGYPSTASNLWPANLTALGRRRTVAPSLFTATTLKEYYTDSQDRRIRWVDFRERPGAAVSAGPNYDEAEAAQGRVKNARVAATGTTTATVSWKAMDSTDCATLEYSTSSAWGTGTRVSVSTGSRLRSVNLTGLTADTGYYVRLLCSAEQPELRFKTQ